MLYDVTIKGFSSFCRSFDDYEFALDYVKALIECNLFTPFQICINVSNPNVKEK